MDKRQQIEASPASASKSTAASTGAAMNIPSSLVGRAHAALGITGATNPESPTVAKRRKKDRLPNWTLPEIFALVEAQRVFFVQDSVTVDGRHLMVPDAGRWLRVSQEVHRAGVSAYPRDGPACKSKWNVLIPEYKRIVDFLARTGTNEKSFWFLTADEKKAQRLPTKFPEELFNAIHDWFRTRSTITPVHTCDLLAADDTNYRSPSMTADETEHGDESENGPEDIFADIKGGSASTMFPIAVVRSGKAKGKAPVHSSVPTSNKAPLPKGTIPPGMTTHLLSSSDTSDGGKHERSGSTGIRRKTVSGHSLIVEATRATGDGMAGQMKQIADASRDLEKNKMELQTKLFNQQIDYQHDRDRRLKENAIQANDNTKLAIQKQADVVECLARLSSVLNARFRRSVDHQAPRASTVRPEENDSFQEL